MDNNIIRKNILNKRDSLTEKERTLGSEKACEKIRDEVKSHIVLCYYPLGSEIDLRPLYDELLKAGRQLFFPVTSGENMDFFRVDSLEDFAEGNFHVMEPAGRDLDRLFMGDVRNGITCITPGTVFDRSKNRMGYGKGYYDRFFARMSEKTCDIFKISVAYNFQIVETIDVNPWDVKMDKVIEIQCETK